MGALSWGMRARYEDGGDVDETPMAPPPPQPAAPRPMLARPGPAMPAQGALSAPDAGGGQGALSVGMSPDNLDPQAAQRLARIQATTAILQAGNAVPSQQPGAVNIPLLAAAGAMLAPTKTGGFAESLGAGMTSGAEALAKQRQSDETARYRMLQQAQLGDYRSGMLDVNQQKAWIAQRALELKARGLDDTAAYRQAMIDARLRGITSREDLGYARIDAARDMEDIRSADRRYGVNTRARTAADAEAGRQARFLQSQEARDVANQLRAAGIDSRLVNSAMLAASKRLDVITGKVPLGKAVQEALEEARRGMRTTPSGVQAPPPARRGGSGGRGESAGYVARPATAAETEQARAAVAADPSKKAEILERFKKANITPPDGL